MRDFHMNQSDALNFPIVQAFALAAFHAETQPFAQRERVGDGYIAQEIERKNFA